MDGFWGILAKRKAAVNGDDAAQVKAGEASLVRQDWPSSQSCPRSVQQGFNNCLTVEIADAIKLAGKSWPAAVHDDTIAAAAEDAQPCLGMPSHSAACRLSASCLHAAAGCNARILAI